MSAPLTERILGINFRTRKAWGLRLFEDTVVRINPPLYPEGPKIPQRKTKEEQAEQQQGGIMGMVKRYWWVLALVFAFTALTGGGGS